MTPELARRILKLHATTEKAQQEIAFEFSANQGRVNEVIKRGKWLTEDPSAPEAIARDKGKAQITGQKRPKPEAPTERTEMIARRQSRKQPLLFSDL